MIQGLNSECSIYRTTTTDDDIGGAVGTRAAVLTGIKCRVSSVRPSIFWREQGGETTRLYNAVIYPAGLDIRENDELYLTSPATHELFNVYLLIMGVQIDSISPGDTRRHTELTLERIERSRGNP